MQAQISIGFRPRRHRGRLVPHRQSSAQRYRPDVHELVRPGGPANGEGGVDQQAYGGIVTGQCRRDGGKQIRHVLSHDCHHAGVRFTQHSDDGLARAPGCGQRTMVSCTVPERFGSVVPQVVVGHMLVVVRQERVRVVSGGVHRGMVCRAGSWGHCVAPPSRKERPCCCGRRNLAPAFMMAGAGQAVHPCGDKQTISKPRRGGGIRTRVRCFSGQLRPLFEEVEGPFDAVAAFLGVGVEVHGAPTA